LNPGESNRKGPRAEDGALLDLHESDERVKTTGLQGAND